MKEGYKIILLYFVLWLLWFLLAGHTRADDLIAMKIELPCWQEWVYVQPGYWDWHPPEYALLFETGEEEDGIPIYEALIVSYEDWCFASVGYYWPYGD